MIKKIEILHTFKKHSQLEFWNLKSLQYVLFKFHNYKNLLLHVNGM